MQRRNFLQTALSSGILSAVIADVARIAASVVAEAAT